MEPISYSLNGNGSGNSDVVIVRNIAEKYRSNPKLFNDNSLSEKAKTDIVLLVQNLALLELLGDMPVKGSYSHRGKV